MPVTQTEDDESPIGGRSRGGLSARPVQDESVGVNGGAPATINKSNVEDDTHGSPRRGRALPASTEKMLADMEKRSSARTPAPHDEGDADEDEPDDDVGDADVEADDDAGEADDDASEDGGGDEDAEGDGEEGDADEGEAADAELSSRLEARNRELISELETARKKAPSKRTDREDALVAAEASYYDEGSIPALRKFLSVITGTAHDSKEVDAELAGVYTDLTARELGVVLDQNQQALRDNARTRLLLARDKREKAEADKKPVADNSADDVQYGEATKHVDGLLATKVKGGTSLKDEYPMLMALSRDFDQVAPGELIARAIRQDIMTGTLDPSKHSDIEMVRHVAPKIEKHYDAVAKRIEAARVKQKKSGTTTPSGTKPKAAVEASTEQRQSPAARTITNAAASRAPAKPPKIGQQKAKTTTAKTRKDFPNDSAWRQHLLGKHFAR